MFISVNDFTLYDPFPARTQNAEEYFMCNKTVYILHVLIITVNIIICVSTQPSLFAVDLFSMAHPAHLGPWPLIDFRNHFSQTVGLLGRVISSSQGLYLNTGQHKHGINAYTHQISML
jgi:hypothetical protein